MPIERLADDGRRIRTFRRNERERVTLATDGVHLLASDDRTDDEGTPVPRVQGRALVFDTPFPRMGFTMVMASGSLNRFMKEVKDQKLKAPLGRLDALYNHDPSQVPFASTADDSLRLRVDKEALHYEFDLDLNLERHRELYSALKEGRLNKSSAAFWVTKEEWDDKPDPPVRTVTEIDMTGGEVSVVRVPANDAADAGLLSDDEPPAVEMFDASGDYARMLYIGTDLKLSD